MELKFWGTRGSYPVCGQEFVRYGQSTSCFEAKLGDGRRLIFDAGSGLAELGSEMIAEETGECAIILSHCHWDHVCGLTTFRPLFAGDWKIRIYVPEGEGHADFIKGLFSPPGFPVPWENLKNKPEIIAINWFEPFRACGVEIRTEPSQHPGGAQAFRVRNEGLSFVYTGDCEFTWGDSESNALAIFAQNVDILIADSHWADGERSGHEGWGHSESGEWLRLCENAGIRRLILTHHAPSRTDAEIEDILSKLRSRSKGVRIFAACPGLVVRPENDAGAQESAERRIFRFFRHTTGLSDTNLAFENILREAQTLTNADAGTIYIVDDGRLEFSFAVNNQLFSGKDEMRSLYLRSSLPMDASSIAGFAAVSRKVLEIPDVRKIAETQPYSFNDAFDRQTGYHTQSVLAVPLLDEDGKAVGVLQLINSMYNGKPRPFTPEMVEAAENFSFLATSVLERAHMSNVFILRMLRTAALRDPLETAGHVRRVGAMAAELYQRHLERRNLFDEAAKSRKGCIRMAAMLHDVGKVGIPDVILKKPGRLTDEERAAMQHHSFLGAELFDDARSEVDLMAYNAILHHHQKWNGEGYTGSNRYPLLAGEDIPLEGRITAIADVFDALYSRRCYKDAWPLEKVQETLQKDAGTHFDPVLIEDFMTMQDIVMDIQRRFSEPGIKA